MPVAVSQICAVAFRVYAKWIPSPATIRLRFAPSRLVQSGGAMWFYHAKRMPRRSEPMRTKTGKIMYYVYILQSITFPDKFYIGYTDDLKRRLAQHNNEHVGYTNKYRPWKIKNYFALDDKQKAKDFEKYLKSQCGREFIKKHFWIPSCAAICVFFYSWFLCAIPYNCRAIVNRPNSLVVKHVLGKDESQVRFLLRAPEMHHLRLFFARCISLLRGFMGAIVLMWLTTTE